MSSWNPLIPKILLQMRNERAFKHHDTVLDFPSFSCTSCEISCKERPFYKWSSILIPIFVRSMLFRICLVLWLATIWMNRPDSSFTWSSEQDSKNFRFNLAFLYSHQCPFWTWAAYKAEYYAENRILSYATHTKKGSRRKTQI